MPPVVSSLLSGNRKVVEVIPYYTNHNPDVTEKFFVRVDVTEEFPFLVTKILPRFTERDGILPLRKLLKASLGQYAWPSLTTSSWSRRWYHSIPGHAKPA